MQRLILHCQYVQWIRTLIRGHRAYWWDFFTATNMAGKATHFTYDALTSKAHHQWCAVTALCRRRKCPYKELVRFGFGGEMRGQMRGFIMQVESMWSSRILWNNNHIQINSKMKINILSQQLISKEYKGSVAHQNTHNSMLHESILCQKKHIISKTIHHFLYPWHYQPCKCYTHWSWNISDDKKFGHSCCVIYGEMYKCKTHASVFSVTLIWHILCCDKEWVTLMILVKKGNKSLCKVSV